MPVTFTYFVFKTQILIYTPTMQRNYSNLQNNDWLFLQSEFFIFVLLNIFKVFQLKSFTLIHRAFYLRQYNGNRTNTSKQEKMNTLAHKIQASQRHKKTTSNVHHINYHYNQQKQLQKQGKFLKQLHKRAKSFSKQGQKSFGQLDSNRQHYIDKLNKYSDEFYSQLLKPQKKAKHQKGQKQKKQDFLKDYIKSESQSKRNKKKFKLELRPAKSSPDNSHSKSGKKLRSTKEKKSIKLKNQSKERKPNPRDISHEKKSKDSKQSKSSQHRKSESLNATTRIHQKREIENNLGRQKKGIQINFRNISLKQKFLDGQSFPMTPQQASTRYQDYFNEIEISQMKQYKNIYFLGKGFGVQKKPMKSARQKICDQIQNQEDLESHKQYHYYETQDYSPEKKPADIQDCQFYKYQIGSHIAYRYEIVCSINRGSFGQVLKVIDHKTGEKLAIKIVKKSKQLVQQTFVEISILTHIKENDKGNTSGIVRIKDFLLFRNHICILFQLLDGNLYELLTANSYKGFAQEIIRVFAVQILNSLNFLRREKIVHCDLKPENLVMKNWGKSGIKLIDFGTSCFEGKQMYSYLQSRYYRAPQVLMQMPYSFPIDMWSFGCMIAQFKLGQPLFSGGSSTQQLLYICSCIGLPDKNNGLFSLAYLQNPIIKQIMQKGFINRNKEGSINLGQNAFAEKYNKKIKKSCLLKLQQRLSKKGSLNPQFLDFLESILIWQPEKRLSPQQALRHPWITKGLSSEIYSLYSSFNTAESCSKSKKNSKDSKNSKQNKQNKQSRQKSKNPQENRKVESKKSVMYENRLKISQNKINLIGKKFLEQNEEVDLAKSVKIDSLKSLKNQGKNEMFQFEKNANASGQILHKKQVLNLNGLR